MDRRNLEVRRIPATHFLEAADKNGHVCRCSVPLVVYLFLVNQRNVRRQMYSASRYFKSAGPCRAAAHPSIFRGVETFVPNAQRYVVKCADLTIVEIENG